MRLKAFTWLFCLVASWLASGPVMAEYRLNLKPANTELGDIVFDLLTLVMIVITVASWPNCWVSIAWPFAWLRRRTSSL